MKISKMITQIFKKALLFILVLVSFVSCQKVIELDLKGEKIMGKLFCTNKLSNIIEDIDAYEGDKYKRLITDVYVKNGSKQLAYVYVLN